MLGLTRSGRLSTIRRVQWNSRLISLNHSRLTHNDIRKQTAVEKHLLDHIKATGPLPFATYMQQCLSHPTHGYYMNPENKVFGTRGDFITSPEISQMFGELVAIWLLSQYELGGKRAPIRLVELGPGKGTLMGDILRVALQFLPGQNINVCLVETSEAMRATQKEHLTYQDRPNVALHWHNSIREIPPSPSEYTMLVAHEFFDALPIHIIQKSETGQWHEVLVASNDEQTSPPEGESKEATPKGSNPSSSFQYVLASQPSTISTLLSMSSPRFKDLPAGTSLEVSPMSFRIARKVGELLGSGSPTAEEENPSMGGCGLIIDYGGNKAFDNSFRAFQNHEIVDVFHEPGSCDLTANVDFAYLKESMSDLVTTHGPMSQRAFLEGMGLKLRVQGLLKAAKTEERREVIRQAAMRLVDPNGMGKEYQVLGITNEPPATGKDTAEQEKTRTPTWPFVEHDA